MRAVLLALSVLLACGGLPVDPKRGTVSVEIISHGWSPAGASITFFCDRTRLPVLRGIGERGPRTTYRVRLADCTNIVFRERRPGQRTRSWAIHGLSPTDRLVIELGGTTSLTNWTVRLDPEKQGR